MTLVERLREELQVFEDDEPLLLRIKDTLDEAADRIEALEKDLRDTMFAYEKQGKELDIYEAALREIIGTKADPLMDDDEKVEAMANIARTALDNASPILVERDDE